MHDRNGQIKSNYEVAINPKTLKTSARRAEIARLILAGHTKDDIMNWLHETFGYQFKQCYSEWKQGYVYCFLTCEEEKEELRKLNLARLESLFAQAERELDVKSKDYYNVQFKNIDLVNKTSGIYDTDIQANQDNDINFNLNINPNDVNDK